MDKPAPHPSPLRIRVQADLIGSIVRALDALAAHTGREPGGLAWRYFGDARRYQDLRSGTYTLKLRTWERVMQEIEADWPPGLPWPPGTVLPARKEAA